MKKTLLTLVGIVGLTGVSLGQYTMGSPTNFPTNLHLKSHTLNSIALGSVEFGGVWSVMTNSNGVPVVTGPPTSTKMGITYRRDIPGGSGNYQTLEVFQDPNHVGHYSQTNPIYVQFKMFDPSGVQLGYITYFGSNTDNLGLWIHNHPAYYRHSFNWSPNVSSLGQPFINGWENGVLVGGPLRPPEFFKAREMMGNLSYQGGRWSPAP